MSNFQYDGTDYGENVMSSPQAVSAMDLAMVYGVEDRLGFLEALERHVQLTRPDWTVAVNLVNYMGPKKIGNFLRLPHDTIRLLPDHTAVGEQRIKAFMEMFGFDESDLPGGGKDG